MADGQHKTLFRNDALDDVDCLALVFRLLLNSELEIDSEVAQHRLIRRDRYDRDCHTR